MSRRSSPHLCDARMLDVSSETFVGICLRSTVNGTEPLDVRTHFTWRVRPH